VHLLCAGGSALDAAVLGCIVSLRHFRRPDTSVVSGTSTVRSQSTMSKPRVIIHDESERVPIPMALHHHPLSVSFAIFDPAHLASTYVSGIGAGTSKTSNGIGEEEKDDEEGVMILVDPTPLETTLCTSKLIVVANSQGEICVLDKAGGRPLSQAVLTRAIQIARRRVKELTQMMDKAIQADASTRIIDVL
jgi:exosome complex component RRP45